MHDFPAEVVLSAGHLMSATVPADFQQCLSLLAVDNCIVTLVGKELPVDAAKITSTCCTEPWYDIPYSVGTIPEAIPATEGNASAPACSQWRAILSGKAGFSAKAGALVPLPIRLPHSNPFLPSDFGLVSAADDGEVEDEVPAVAGIVACLAAPGVYKRPV